MSLWIIEAQVSDMASGYVLFGTCKFMQRTSAVKGLSELSSANETSLCSLRLTKDS